MATVLTATEVINDLQVRINTINVHREEANTNYRNVYNDCNDGTCYGVSYGHGYPTNNIPQVAAALKDYNYYNDAVTELVKIRNEIKAAIDSHLQDPDKPLIPSLANKSHYATASTETIYQAAVKTETNNKIIIVAVIIAIIIVAIFLFRKKLFK